MAYNTITATNTSVAPEHKWWRHRHRLRLGRRCLRRRHLAVLNTYSTHARHVVSLNGGYICCACIVVAFPVVVVVVVYVAVAVVAARSAVATAEVSLYS